MTVSKFIMFGELARLHHPVGWSFLPTPWAKPRFATGAPNLAERMRSDSPPDCGTTVSRRHRKSRRSWRRARSDRHHESPTLREEPLWAARAVLEISPPTRVQPHPGARVNVLDSRLSRTTGSLPEASTRTGSLPDAFPASLAGNDIRGSWQIPAVLATSLASTRSSDATPELDLFFSPSRRRTILDNFHLLSFRNEQVATPDLRLQHLCDLLHGARPGLHTDRVTSHDRRLVPGPSSHRSPHAPSHLSALAGLCHD